MPRHELVDAGSQPAVDESGQGVGEPGVRIDVVQFACLDERRDDCPVRDPLVRTCEQGILSIQCDRPDGALDGVSVQLDAAVADEAG